MEQKIKFELTEIQYSQLLEILFASARGMEERLRTVFPRNDELNCLGHKVVSDIYGMVSILNNQATKQESPAAENN